MGTFSTSARRMYYFPTGEKMNWLHFVGGKYYTIKEFEDETRLFNVSRRISVQLLKQFNYGDRVYLFTLDGNSSVCFGYFDVESILAALSAEMKADLAAAGKITETTAGGSMVTRGCGSYTMGCSYSVNCSIPELAAMIEKHGSDVVMIGGPYTSLCNRIRSSIPFQRGFRRFNWEDFYGEYEKQKTEGRKRPKVMRSGIVGKDEIEWRVTEGGVIREVINYQRKEEIKPDNGLFDNGAEK